MSNFDFEAAQKEKRMSQEEYFWQTQRKFNGVFDCHGGYTDDQGKLQRYQYSKTSLFCLSDQNKVRQGFVWLATWKWFDNFITLAIIINSLMLGTTDYQDRLDPQFQSAWTPKQEQIDIGFSCIFISECIIKVISMGFCMHKKSYLREPWNCLDFFIVCIVIIGFLPVKGGSDSLKSLRTFRILRPLRSINRMPAMRKQIQSLLGSIPGLMRVFFFIMFIFSIFAIFGSNQFMGKQYKFCRSTIKPDFDENGMFEIWNKLGEQEDGPVLCEVDADCVKAFPDSEVAICGSLQAVTGLDPVEFDGVRDIELIMYGIPGFDNVAQGFLSIFQVLTLESWVFLMYNYCDAGNNFISIVFFILVVVIGAFFTMNLVLAIIVDAFKSYSDEQKKQQQQSSNNKQQNESDDEKEEEQASSEKIEEMRRQNPLLLEYLEQVEYEETVKEKELRLMLLVRIAKSDLARTAHGIVTTVGFNFFIFLLIIGNTITLAAYSYDQSEQTTSALELLNNLFTWVFFVEMVLKLIGLGWHNYKADNYNLFDALIVSISLIDFTLSSIPSLNTGNILNVLRALRLLRMLKLAKAWHALEDILQKTAKSLKDISNFSLLLLLFMYIFALLGMELFANIALIDAQDNLIVGRQAVQQLYRSGEFYTFPRDNFNNIGWSLTTVFIIIIGEDWNWTMYQWVRAYGYASSVSYHIAIFYFVVLMIFGNIVLFSLFTAILLQNFEGDSEDDETEATNVEEESKSRWERFVTGFIETFSPKKPKQVKAIEEQSSYEPPTQDKNQLQEDQESVLNDQTSSERDSDEETNHKDKKEKQSERIKEAKKNILPQYAEQDSQLKQKSTILFVENQLPPLMEYSLFCLSPDNFFRKVCHALAENKWFQNIIMFLIVFSTVTLAFETPLDNPDSFKINVLDKINLFMTSAFTFEMLVKIVARGFAFAGKDSYIRQPWNILDFIIVASALLSTLASDLEISFLKSLRILRMLRPLRLISRVQGLKMAIAALFASLPRIVYLELIVFFFVYLLAILQTTLFSGTFYSCNTDHLNLSIKQQIGNIVTMWDCLNYGGEWTKPDLNYDSTIVSLITMMTIQTTEGWTDVMWNSVDAVGPYRQPVENHNIFMVVYTMIIILIVCMLFIELFVGIVTETFNNQKELMSGNKLLNPQQRAWLQVQLMAWKSEPRGKGKKDEESCVGWCQRVTESKLFDKFIMYCILLNTCVLASKFYRQPEELETLLEVLNYLFVLIFMVEAVMKITAQGKHYFEYSWNRFDFTIVVVTTIVLIIIWSGVSKELEILSSIIRCLRIFRILRLVNKHRGLQAIFATLIQATPAMGSLGVLLMLLIFMFSIIGMSLFALVNLDGAAEMNEHVNFQSFGTAFLTLLRCSTGEAWNAIMFDSYQANSILYQCNETEDFYSIVERGDDPTDIYGPKGCGSSFAVAFHILFQVIVSQVFLNLFIAIIIDAFFGQTDLAKLALQQKCFDDFTLHWSHFDRDRNGMISLEDLQKLLIRLAQEADPSEGGVFIPFKKQLINDTQDRKFMKRLLMSLDIPIYIGEPNLEDNQDEKTAVQVKFHDVLIKLSYMSVRIYFLGSELKQIQKALEVMKRATGQPIYSDYLQAQDWQHPFELNDFDKSLIRLNKMLKDKNTKGDLITEFKQVIRSRIQEDNEAYSKKEAIVVATNEKEIMKRLNHNKAEFNKRYKSQGQQQQFLVEVYTTKYFVSAQIIYELINSYNESRKQLPEQ